MNYGVMYDAGLAGEVRVTVDSLPKMALTSARSSRAGLHSSYRPNGVINLGVGAPDGVANVANEEKVTPYLVMTTEAGRGRRRAGGRIELRLIGKRCTRSSIRTRCSISTMAAVST